MRSRNVPPCNDPDQCNFGKVFRYLIMRKISGDFAIRDARLLMAEHDKRFGHENALALLDRWEQSPVGKSFKALTEDAGAHQDFLKRFIDEVEPFDCLLIAGWQPSENELSNVIAALFSQSWGHRFGATILKSILAVIASKCSLSAVKGEVIKDIQRCCNSRTQLFVRREHWGGSSRADVDIYTPGPEGFLVRIEHKIRGGSETYQDRKYQTFRLWNDANTQADDLLINRDRVIGIFLTPSGEPARSGEFVNISYGVFADAVRAAVTKQMAVENGISAAAASILGFIGFYGRT
jgi:hypothetical protein